MPKEHEGSVFFDYQPDSSNVVTPSTRKNIDSQTTRGGYFLYPGVLYRAVIEGGLF